MTSDLVYRHPMSKFVRRGVRKFLKHVPEGMGINTPQGIVCKVGDEVRTINVEQDDQGVHFIVVNGMPKKAPYQVYRDLDIDPTLWSRVERKTVKYTTQPEFVEFTAWWLVESFFPREAATA